LDKIQGRDLRVFDFDYDLTFMIFFLNADEKVYGRFGGRDAKSAEARLSLDGLRFAMNAALLAHKTQPQAKPVAPVALAVKPVLPENYLAAKSHKGCIHCHQIWEFRRHEAKLTGKFKRDELWIYPLPENVGIILDVDQGNKVRSVTSTSPAGKAGIRASDRIERINNLGVASFADFQYGLHRAPATGQVAITWQHDGQPLTAQLDLPDGWRKTNPTWRPSMLDILPALSLYGDDLTAQEKKDLKLPDKRLAFRQDRTVGKEAKKMGVQGGDVIIGIDNLDLEMSMLDFLGYIRRNYLVGDKITLNVIRNGKRIDLPGKL
jgi:S1-C subfamily serine protease